MSDEALKPVSHLVVLRMEPAVARLVVAALNVGIAQRRVNLDSSVQTLFLAASEAAEKFKAFDDALVRIDPRIYNAFVTALTQSIGAAEDSKPASCPHCACATDEACCFCGEVHV